MSPSLRPLLTVNQLSNERFYFFVHFGQSLTNHNWPLFELTKMLPALNIKIYYYYYRTNYCTHNTNIVTFLKIKNEKKEYCFLDAPHRSCHECHDRQTSPWTCHYSVNSVSLWIYSCAGSVKIVLWTH